VDSKVVVYLYSETSATDFTEAHKPFVKSDVAKKFGTANLINFKECGGLKITDRFENTKTHIRKSFWSSAEGYEQWQAKMQELGYLDERSQYQKQNHIEVTLQGPLEENQNAK
jgi:hypothetical protein